MAPMKRVLIVIEDVFLVELFFGRHVRGGGRGGAGGGSPFYKPGGKASSSRAKGSEIAGDG
jgi:hypothetical protein